MPGTGSTAGDTPVRGQRAPWTRGVDMDDVSIDVQQRAAAWLVRLHGELDAGDVPAFNRALAPLVDDAREGVVVDLSAARMLDSTMLGALVGWQGHARQQ